MFHAYIGHILFFYSFLKNFINDVYIFRDPTPVDCGLSKWETYKESKSYMTIDLNPQMTNIKDIERDFNSRMCWWMHLGNEEFQNAYKQFDLC